MGEKALRPSGQKFGRLYLPRKKACSIKFLGKMV